MKLGSVVRRLISPNLGLNILTHVSFSFVHFSGQFSLFFLEHQIIKLWTKRIKLNLLFKLHISIEILH